LLTKAAAEAAAEAAAVVGVKQVLLSKVLTETFMPLTVNVLMTVEAKVVAAVLSSAGSR